MEDPMRQRLTFGTAALSVLLTAASASAQANFGTYVSVGDSLAAGYQSNSLLEAHQAVSVPALIARQAQVADFQQPLIGEPGIPPEIILQSLVPVPALGPKSATPGAPRNLGLNRPYNNLAVPGATSVDAATRTTDTGGFHDIILRGRGTQVAQAVSLRPTFVTLWIGNNDVLGAAIRGTAVDGVTLTPAATFRTVYGQIVAALRGTGATVIAANLPDVTTIPFVTTIRPYVTNPTTGEPLLTAAGARIPLLGPRGPLTEDTFVTLAASVLLARGDGIPAAAGGRGTPLPDEVLLDPAEVAVIRTRVNDNNQAIREICQSAGVAVLDVNGLLREIATTGRNVGGVVLTSAFLSGGVFSYDGVHPTDLGYALVANEWIRAINAGGGTLPEVDLGPVLGTSLRGDRAEVRLPGRPELTAEAYQNLLAAFPTLDRP
jgi:lysophospholipase L1-like esterase